MPSNSSFATERSDSLLFLFNWENVSNVSVASLSLWLIFVGICILVFAWRVPKIVTSRFSFNYNDNDEGQIGKGKQKIFCRPNRTDRQIAYEIWIEASTRKIGLPIDFNDDVIVEVFDSWYKFSGIIRNLIKQIPARNLNRDYTKMVLELTVDVMNLVLRPHLTRWQARFRFWYNNELRKHNTDGNEQVLDSQTLQARFPDYEELKADMQKVNALLIAYKDKMHELVFNC